MGVESDLRFCHRAGGLVGAQCAQEQLSGAACGWLGASSSMSTWCCCRERVSERCPDALLSPLLYELAGPGRKEAVGPSWEPWRRWGPRAGYQQAVGSSGLSELCSPPC